MSGSGSAPAQPWSGILPSLGGSGHIPALPRGGHRVEMPMAGTPPWSSSTQTPHLWSRMLRVGQATSPPRPWCCLRPLQPLFPASKTPLDVPNLSPSQPLTRLSPQLGVDTPGLE